MGYAFALQKPADGFANTVCGFNNDQMSYVRLVMLEASVIDGDGFRAANRSGLEVCDETLPASRFVGVGGRVTAGEAAFIARRLRQATERGLIGDLLDFLDEHPGEPAVRAWVNEFVDLNERASYQDGYSIV
jgi:hypothetical protein